MASITPFLTTQPPDITGAINTLVVFANANLATNVAEYPYVEVALALDKVNGFINTLNATGLSIPLFTSFIPADIISNLNVLARYMNILGAGPVTSWDAATLALPSWITFTRSTLGWYWNSSGVFTQAAINTPRFDYGGPVPVFGGLLIEETRTNSVIQNRDLTQAAWVAVTMTPAKDQTGVDGVASSASSILATAGNATILQTITLVSAPAFQTAYVRRLTGSGVINMTMDNGATWTPITVTAAWSRVSIPTQTLANPVVGFQIVTNGDKIAVDLVQNENGAFATSAIPTTTSAVARSVDLPVGSVAGAGINTTQGTIAVRFQPSVAAQNSSAVILEGSGGVGVTIGYNGSVNVQGWDRIAGRTFVGQTGGVTVNELIMSYGSVASAESFNGLTAAYTGSIGISPWGTTFNIGSRSGSSLFYNGYIRGVAFYNQMLTQAQQNRLTAALAF